MSARRPNLDSVTTINTDGSRYFLHPADVRGLWTRLRRVVGLVLIAIYIALPWIPINGNPAVFLDVQYRKFHLFGLTLWPQDLWVMFSPSPAPASPCSLAPHCWAASGAAGPVPTPCSLNTSIAASNV